MQFNCPKQLLWVGAMSLVLVAHLQANPQSKGETPAVPAAKTPAKTPAKGKSMKMGKIQKMRPAPKLSPEELEKRYAKKLEGPWIAKGKWILDFDEARARAKREGKLIFVYFTRSYSY